MWRNHIVERRKVADHCEEGENREIRRKE